MVKTVTNSFANAKKTRRKSLFFVEKKDLAAANYIFVFHFFFSFLFFDFFYRFFKSSKKFVKTICNSQLLSPFF